MKFTQIGKIAACALIALGSLVAMNPNKRKELHPVLEEAQSEEEEVQAAQTAATTTQQEVPSADFVTVITDEPTPMTIRLEKQWANQMPTLVNLMREISGSQAFVLNGISNENLQDIVATLIALQSLPKRPDGKYISQDVNDAMSHLDAKPLEYLYSLVRATDYLALDPQLTSGAIRALVSRLKYSNNSFIVKIKPKDDDTDRSPYRIFDTGNPAINEERKTILTNVSNNTEEFRTYPEYFKSIPAPYETKHTFWYQSRLDGAPEKTIADYIALKDNINAIPRTEDGKFEFSLHGFLYLEAQEISSLEGLDQINCQSISHIDFYNNNLVEMPRENLTALCPHLILINLSRNLIRDIEIEDMQRLNPNTLRKLVINGDEDIEYGAFNGIEVEFLDVKDLIQNMTKKAIGGAIKTDISPEELECTIQFE